MNTDLMFSSLSNEWETPPDLFKKLDDEFHFTLDPCCTHENHLCPTYYTKEDDGLSKDWSGHIVYVNPPYGREIGKWVKKCHDEKGAVCVMCIPARTDTRWFHEYIYGKAEIRFLRGRIKFKNRAINKVNSAPFPSMIVIYHRF